QSLVGAAGASSIGTRPLVFSALQFFFPGYCQSVIDPVRKPRQSGSTATWKLSLWPKNHFGTNIAPVRSVNLHFTFKLSKLCLLTSTHWQTAW
ncbi:MAG: hypothetical protein ACK52I_29080, partial [Pseudomonadota bacterium]